MVGRPHRFVNCISLKGSRAAAAAVHTPLTDELTSAAANTTADASEWVLSDASMGERMRMGASPVVHILIVPCSQSIGTRP